MIYYVATPYSHPDPAVRQGRYEAVTKFTARLAQIGVLAYVGWLLEALDRDREEQALPWEMEE